MRLLFERVRRDVRQLAAAGQRGLGSTFPCPCGCGQVQTKEPPTGCAWEVVYCICELMDAVGAQGKLGLLGASRVCLSVRAAGSAAGLVAVQRCCIFERAWRGRIGLLVVDPHGLPACPCLPAPACLPACLQAGMGVPSCRSCKPSCGGRT